MAEEDQQPLPNDGILELSASGRGPTPDYVMLKMEGTNGTPPSDETRGTNPSPSSAPIAAPGTSQPMSSPAPPPKK
jgi:hypothetical protein